MQQPTDTGGDCVAGDQYGEFAWTYSWETTFEDGERAGTVLVDEYPVVEWQELYGNDQKLKIDFTDDTTFDYVGNMTVKLYGILLNGFGQTFLEFHVDHQPHPCKQSINNFVATSEQT